MPLAKQPTWDGAAPAPGTVNGATAQVQAWGHLAGVFDAAFSAIQSQDPEPARISGIQVETHDNSNDALNASGSLVLLPGGETDA